MSIQIIRTSLIPRTTIRLTRIRKLVHSFVHAPPHFQLKPQVVGRKYVRLYAPSLSDHLCPFPSGTLNSNSSQVDLDVDLDSGRESGSRSGSESEFESALHATRVRRPEHVNDIHGSDRCRGRRFPGVATLPYQDLVLEPGQMLYIPPGWWHFVRSLSTSFSVSFWWR